MIGIYLIRNEINNKVYIGQSRDIERRFKEHLRAAQPDKYAKKNERNSSTPIHLAMNKYGIENFTLKILEQCSVEELNGKEKYWIETYKSVDKAIGYNLTKGGQENRVLYGEENSQSKLTNIQVEEIKDLLKNSTKSLVEINQLFPIVSKSTISMINTGKIWFDKKDSYPIRKEFSSQKGQKNGRAKLSDSQVMEIRKKYSEGMSFSEICNTFENLATKSSIRAAVYGETFKHLPIYKKKENKWI